MTDRSAKATSPRYPPEPAGICIGPRRFDSALSTVVWRRVSPHHHYIKVNRFPVGLFSCALPRVCGASCEILGTSLPGRIPCLGPHFALSAPLLPTTSLWSAASRPACGCPKSLPAILSLRPRSPAKGRSPQVPSMTPFNINRLRADRSSGWMTASPTRRKRIPVPVGLCGLS